MPLPSPSPARVAVLLGLAAVHQNVLQQTVGPEGEPFDTHCDGGVYNGVEALTWIPEQVSALEYLCQRLAFAPFRCSPADPAAAAEYKGEIAEVWRNNPGLRCGIGCPEAPFLEDTVEGASVSTWPRYHNALNVYGLAAFLEATPTKAFFQTAHAAMRRSGVTGLFTLSLTICISLCSFAMLGLCLALRQFDGQCLTDLTGEKKTAGSDGLEHLVAPSDLGSYECYAALFRKLLDGRLAFLFVDGALGRKCLMRYIKEHNGRASPLSQQTLCMLNQNKCDFDTDLIATNAGAIFLLYINGSMHLVFLRPSIGSWFFELQRAHAKHGQAEALKIVHNQLWLLSVFMCINTVDVFRTATSVLLAMMQTANQEAVTAFLHARGWLAEHVSFVTPWSLGGKVCYALKRGIFDPKNAALVAAGRSLGGQTCYNEELGVFDPANAALVAAGRSLAGQTVKQSCPMFELRCVEQNSDGTWTVVSGSGGEDGEGGEDGGSWVRVYGITDAGRRAGPKRGQPQPPQPPEPAQGQAPKGKADRL